MIKEVDVDGDGRIDFYGKIFLSFLSYRFYGINNGEKEISISTNMIHPYDDRWTRI